MNKDIHLTIMSLLAIVNGALACYNKYELQEVQKQYHECVVDHDMAYMISPDMMYFIKDIGGAKDFLQNISEYDYE